MRLKKNYNFVFLFFKVFSLIYSESVNPYKSVKALTTGTTKVRNNYSICVGERALWVHVIHLLVEI